MSLSEYGIDHSVKVVLLGASGVGKSSVAYRFTLKKYDEKYTVSTIGAAYLTKRMDVLCDATDEFDSSEGNPQEVDTQLLERKSRRIEFKIWDTAGQERYASLAPMYYRGAGAAIVVFDLTSRSSFDVLKLWVEELRSNGPSGIVLALCGNKSDLFDKREVSAEEAAVYAESIGAFYIEVSARDDKNIETLFLEIAKRVPQEDPDELIRRAKEEISALGNPFEVHKPQAKARSCCRV